MDDTEFDAALAKLQDDYEYAKSRNHNKRYKTHPGVENISTTEYNLNERKIWNGFQNAKHRLYEKHAEAKIADKPCMKISCKEKLLEANNRMHQEIGPPPYAASSFIESPVDDNGNVSEPLDSIDENTGPSRYCWATGCKITALAGFICLLLVWLIIIIVVA